MQTREMTEDEQQVLRDGLRMVARLIARRHLAEIAAAEASDAVVVAAESEGTES